MRYVVLTIDLLAGALVVAGAWLLAPWLALWLAGILLALVAMLIDPAARKRAR